MPDAQPKTPVARNTVQCSICGCQSPLFTFFVLDKEGNWPCPRCQVLAQWQQGNVAAAQDLLRRAGRLDPSSGTAPRIQAQIATAVRAPGQGRAMWLQPSHPITQSSRRHHHDLTP